MNPSEGMLETTSCRRRAVRSNAPCSSQSAVRSGVCRNGACRYGCPKREYCASDPDTILMTITAKVVAVFVSNLKGRWDRH